MKYFRPLSSFIAIFALLTGFGYAGGSLQEIPAGSVISVRMIDSISSDQNEPGQVFRGELASPVRINNRVVLPRGAAARVRLVSVRSAGHLKGRNELMLQLDRVGGHAVQSEVVGYRGSSQGKKTLKSAGIGAAIGGGVGALIGGGTGAAVGGSLGAGAGVATRAAKEPRPIRIVSESVVNFRLAAPMRIG